MDQPPFTVVVPLTQIWGINLELSGSAVRAELAGLAARLPDEPAGQSARDVTCVVAGQSGLHLRFRSQGDPEEARVTAHRVAEAALAAAQFDSEVIVGGKPGRRGPACEVRPLGEVVVEGLPQRKASMPPVAKKLVAAERPVDQLVAYQFFAVEVEVRIHKNASARLVQGAIARPVVDKSQSTSARSPHIVRDTGMLPDLASSKAVFSFIVIAEDALRGSKFPVAAEVGRAQVKAALEHLGYTPSAAQNAVGHATAAPVVRRKVAQLPLTDVNSLLVIHRLEADQVPALEEIADRLIHARRSAPAPDPRDSVASPGVQTIAPPRSVGSVRGSGGVSRGEGGPTATPAG